MPKTDPQRSCLGCRVIADKDSLLRFVLAPDNSVVPDVGAKLPGRGAYTCYNNSCLESAIKKRQFGRAFRQDVISPPVADMERVIVRLLESRILSYISLANKAGKVVSGSDKVMDTLRRRSAALLILATDISMDSKAKFAALATATDVKMVSFLTKEQLGAPLGKDIRSAVAILPCSFAETLGRELTRYWNFFEGGA